jgi:hypothetical protein
MQMNDIPFATTDWSDIEHTEHGGESGLAYWRTCNFGDLRVRMVEYTGVPGGSLVRKGAYLVVP